MKYNVVQINPKLVQCYINNNEILNINKSYLYNVLFRWESFVRGTTPLIKFYARELSHIRVDNSIDLRDILNIISIAYNDYYVANNITNIYILDDGKIAIRNKDMNFVCSCMYNGVEYINVNIVKTSQLWKSTVNKYKKKCSNNTIFHPSFNNNFNDEYSYYLLLEYLTSIGGTFISLSDRYGMIAYFLSLYTNLITFALVDEKDYNFSEILKTAMSDQYGIMNNKYVDVQAISNFNYILIFDDISIDLFNKIKNGTNNTIFYRKSNDELFETIKQIYKYVDIIGASNGETYYRMRKEIFE